MVTFCVSDWRSQKDLFSVKAIYFPPASWLSRVFLPCLLVLVASIVGCFLSPFCGHWLFLHNSDETLKITDFVTVFLFCIVMIISVFLRPALWYWSCLNSSSHLLCQFHWNEVDYSHGSAYCIYTTKYELYTAPTRYYECWMCCQTHGISHLFKPFQDWYHHQYILYLCLFCLPFFFFTFLFSFLCFWRHVECACLIWVDVQTGCVWAGVPLSVHLFAALILGFVCSIWAKFSNGDYYWGRPGERRRWVLPFLIEWAACFSKPVNYISQHPPLSFLIPVTVCAIKYPVEHWVCFYHAAIHSDCSLSSD